MKIDKHQIIPTYKKNNGLWVVDIDSIKVPFKVKERSLVYIPAGQFGGNHKHPRIEAFIGIGKDLELIWKDNNSIKTEKMNSNSKIYLFVVHPFVEHAVINRSKNQPGLLIEFADQIQREVVPCDII